MKLRLVLVRFAVIFLMLILSQKIGVGLALHNLLHTSGYNSSNTSQQNENKGQELNITCNCIDDFLMPFVPGTEMVITTPESDFVFGDDLRSHSLQTTALIHFPLRGPPSIL